MKVRVLLGACALAVAFAFVGEASAQVPAGNHYLCRKVKDRQDPAKFVSVPGIAVTDQIGNDTCEAKKPFLLCSPLTAKGGPVAVPNPLLHYTCYKAKCGLKPAVAFDTTD
jgi:hypothetical protein